MLTWSFGRAYWADYSDYQDRVLSVDYDLSNNGSMDAFAVRVLDSVNTNAVILIPVLPPPLDLAAASAGPLTLKYIVPPGVSLFKSATYVTAADACDNSFSYPGPSPGSS